MSQELVQALLAAFGPATLENIGKAANIGLNSTKANLRRLKRSNECWNMPGIAMGNVGGYRSIWGVI